MVSKYAWRLYTREKYALRMERVIRCDINDERVDFSNLLVERVAARELATCLAYSKLLTVSHLVIHWQFLSPGNYSTGALNWL